MSNSRTRRRSLVNDSVFWSYIQINKADREYLIDYLQQIRPTDNPTILDFMQNTLRPLGVLLHPCLVTCLAKTYINQPGPLSLEIPASAKPIRQISFKNHKIDEVTLRVLADAINLENIVCMTFDNNSPSDNSASLIGECIKRNKLLARLNFQYNSPASDLACIPSAKILESIPYSQIEILNLKGNSIGDAQLSVLIEGFTKNEGKMLRILQLYRNNITGTGVDSLANLLCLRKLPKLQYLGLGKNKFQSLSSLCCLFEKALCMQKMLPEEVQAYQAAVADQKQCEEMIAKKKKPPKKLQDVRVPEGVHKISQEYWRIPNYQVSSVNLIENNFGDEDVQALQKICKGAHNKLKIGLALNSFCSTSLSKEALKFVVL